MMKATRLKVGKRDETTTRRGGSKRRYFCFGVAQYNSRELAGGFKCCSSFGRPLKTRRKGQPAAALKAAKKV